MHSPSDIKLIHMLWWTVVSHSNFHIWTAFSPAGNTLFGLDEVWYLRVCKKEMKRGMQWWKFLHWYLFYLQAKIKECAASTLWVLRLIRPLTHCESSQVQAMTFSIHTQTEFFLHGCQDKVEVKRFRHLSSHIKLIWAMTAKFYSTRVKGAYDNQLRSVYTEDLNEGWASFKEIMKGGIFSVLHSWEIFHTVRKYIQRWYSRTCRYHFKYSSVSLNILQSLTVTFILDLRWHSQPSGTTWQICCSEEHLHPGPYTNIKNISMY